MTGVLLGVLALATAPCPTIDPLDVLTQYVATEFGGRCGGDDELRTVLAFDHATARWTLFDLRWDCTRSQVALIPSSRVRMQLNGVPRVELPSGDRSAVLVYDTNPALYGVSRGDAKDEDIEELAALQQFAGLLGGFLSAGATIAGTKPLDLAGVVPEAGIFDVQPGAAAMMDILPGVEDRRRGFVAAGKTLTDRAASELEAARPRLRALDAARKDLAGALDHAKAQSNAVRAFIQAVEDGDEPQSPSGLPQVRIRFSNAMEAVRDARRRLAEHTLGCHAPFASLHAGIRTAMDPNKSEVALEAARRQFRGSVQELEDRASLLASGCAPAEADAFELLRKELVALPPSREGMPEAIREPWRRLRAVAGAFVELRTQITEAIQAAQSVLDEEPSGLKLVHQLEEADRRIGPPRPACHLARGVLPVAEPDLAPRLTKVGQRSLTVDLDSPWREKIVTRREKQVAEYQIVSRQLASFGVGVGLTYTGLSDPTWTAVPNPENGDQMVIARTDEETRAGQYAAILTLYPGRTKDLTVRPGLDLGVGLTSSKPSVFLGASLGVSFLRLSGGLTLQQVKALTGEQRELTLRGDGTADPASLTLIKSADEIRTRNVLEDSWYVALQISIDSLPFFKADD